MPASLCGRTGGRRTPLEINELESLVELLKNARISELTLKQGDHRITLRKPADVPTGSALVPVGDTPYTETELQGDWEVEATPAAPEPITIIAPLVGFFHHIKPVIGLGAHIAEGQTIALVRAMQLDNEVKSSVTGTVTDVLVEDGLPVEYGQPLYRIQPSE